MLALTLDGGIGTVLFNLFVLRLGHGPEGVGTIAATANIVFALACVPIGRLGEWLGLLRVMRVGMALTLLGTVLTPMAGWLDFSLQLPAIIAAQILVVIGLAAYFVIAAPYVMRLTTPDQRPAMFSAQSTMFSVFGFLGGILGGVIPSGLTILGLGAASDPGPYLWALFSIPVFVLLTLLSLQRMRHVDEIEPSSEKPSESKPAPALAGGALLGLIVFFGLLRLLQVGGVATTQTFFNVYMDSELNVSTEVIGAIIAMAKLLGVPAALAIPWLTRKFGSGGVVVGALIFAAAGMIPLALLRLPAFAALGYIMVWLSTPVRYGAFMIYILARTPSRMHATLNGTQEALAGAAFALTAYVGGSSVQTIGYSALFLAGAGAMLLGAVLLLIELARRKSQPHIR